MRHIRGGVTAPAGFTASGIHCGVRRNKEKRDLALIFSELPCAAAACFTTNKVKGQPVVVSAEHLANGVGQAIICNSGNANTCTGDEGLAVARRMAELVAERLPVRPEDVVVASTGIIGQLLDVTIIERGMDALVEGLSPSGSIAAREAIMTTDTMKKEVAVSLELGDGTVVTLGAIAKGSGMIHPNMATMLAFITSDCAIEASMLQAALSSAVARTFNRISVDGDTSTNDMVVALANGKAGNAPIAAEGPDFRAFQEALGEICTELARLIARDGEGATKLVECIVSGAVSEAEAVLLSKAVISSSLVKTALFGSDANWGRILCALGYSPATVDPSRIGVAFESGRGYLEVCKDGAAMAFSEEKAKKVLSDSEVTILVDLGLGAAQATAWGCDLSYEYVRINGDYRT